MLITMSFQGVKLNYQLFFNVLNYIIIFYLFIELNPVNSIHYMDIGLFKFFLYFQWILACLDMKINFFKIHIY